MTEFQIIAGIAFLLIGCMLVLFRDGFVKIAHSLLKRMYGEVFADVTVNRRLGPAITCVVGVLFLALGAYFILDAFRP